MNKKIALATMAILPLACSSVSASGNIGIINASSLNVRTGPSTNYSILCSVKRGEKVEILESRDGWYKIKTESNKVGWSSSSYIDISNSNNVSTSNTKFVNTDRLNMRSGPSTSYRVIKVLNLGEEVEVVSESNGWTKIRSEQRLGYVSSKYLTDKKIDNSQNQESNKTIQKEVTASSLNVREGASTSHKVIGRLNRYSKVEVLSEANGWSKIKYNGKEAYVYSKYLKTVNSNVSSDNTTNNGETNTTIQKEVTASALNVREGASTSHKVIGSLSKGTKVEVISEANGWSKIKYNGKEAYVSSQYLKDVQASVVGGENSQVTNSGATINNKQLNYTLKNHVDVQYERSLVGGNVIDSTLSRGFVPAQKDDLEYFLDVNNFTKSNTGMMQFLRIDNYREGITASELNSYLNSLPKNSNGTNVFYNQGQAFINAAKKYDIDVVYLVSHAMWETAYGSSTLAKGQTITKYKGQTLPKPVKVYNFFGIGAIDGSANLSGAEAAYSNGWTSVEATIDGSAKWIANNYIKSSKYNQNTIYKMKFNYDYSWHQYATDVNWANGISKIMIKIIEFYDNGRELVFEVPSYK